MAAKTAKGGRPKSPPPEWLDEAIRMRSEGMSVRAIAEELGFGGSHMKVYLALKDAGVDTAYQGPIAPPPGEQEEPEDTGPMDEVAGLEKQIREVRKRAKSLALRGLGNTPAYLSAERLAGDLSVKLATMKRLAKSDESEADTAPAMRRAAARAAAKLQRLFEDALGAA